MCSSDPEIPILGIVLQCKCEEICTKRCVQKMCTKKIIGTQSVIGQRGNTQLFISRKVEKLVIVIHGGRKRHKKIHRTTVIRDKVQPHVTTQIVLTLNFHRMKLDT